MQVGKLANRREASIKCTYLGRVGRWTFLVKASTPAQKGCRHDDCNDNQDTNDDCANERDDPDT